MFQTKLLPELASNLTRVKLIASQALQSFEIGYGYNSLLLPHWPAWMVMISLSAHRKPKQEYRHIEVATYLGITD